MSSDVILNAVCCKHNIAGIKGPKVSYTESLVAFTDPRWRLLIRWWQLLYRNVVTLSALAFNITQVLITDPRKKRKKFVKTDPKKVPSQKKIFARLSRYNDPTFYEKKNSHFIIL